MVFSYTSYTLLNEPQIPTYEKKFKNKLAQQKIEVLRKENLQLAKSTKFQLQSANGK